MCYLDFNLVCSRLTYNRPSILLLGIIYNQSRKCILFELIKVYFFTCLTRVMTPAIIVQALNNRNATLKDSQRALVLPAAPFSVMGWMFLYTLAMFPFCSCISISQLQSSSLFAFVFLHVLTMSRL